jgi:uncharacterized protein (TIGR03067 family)
MPRALLALALAALPGLTAPVPKPLQRDRPPNFDGGWEVYEAYIDGRESGLPPYQWWVSGGRVYRGPDLNRLADENWPALEVPADARPGQVDYVVRTGDRVQTASPGRYEFDGDTLRLCYAGWRNTARPDDLKPAPGNIVLLMRRVKDEPKR